MHVLGYSEMGIALLVILLIGVIVRAGIRAKKLSLRFRIKPLMTENKREFYGRLLTALPEYHVYPQVGFQAIVQPNSRRFANSYFREQALLKENHCDFLVCDKETLWVVAIISLDDPKSQKKTSAIETLLASTDYQSLHFCANNKPSILEIKAAFYNLPGMPQKESAQTFGADVLHLQSNSI